MTAQPPFAGAVLLADASAWHRHRHPRVREEFVAAVAADQIATCSIVRLELLYSARDVEEVRATRADHAVLREVAVTASVQRAATGALEELAAISAGHHRVPIADLLIAAAAQEAAVGVLHYDHHYDRLAEVLEFDSRWLARPA